MLIVLSLLVIGSILVAGSVAISQLTAIETYNCIDFEHTSYYVESAANTARWMMLLDRSKNTNRNLVLSSDDSATSEPRWQADGRIHTIKIDEEVTAEVQVLDMSGMINLCADTRRSTAYSYLLSYYNLEDAEKRTLIEELSYKIKDYVDTDDSVRTNGMEVGDYEALGLTNLPRNGAIQYKEEFYWIPGVLELLPTETKDGLHHGVMPVVSKQTNLLAGYRPNFFSAPKILLRAGMSSMSDSEIERVYEARKEYFTEGTSIEDTLEETTISALKQKFSFNETGYYYFIIKVRLAENKPQRTFIFACQSSELITPKFIDWQML